MTFSGPFVLFLIITIVALLLALSFKGWIGKLVMFILALGAMTITVGAANVDPIWALVLNIVLFIAVGLSSVRVKNTGNRILGIVLIVIGVALIFPAIGDLGSTAPGSIWAAVIDSLEQGWASFWNSVQQAIGGT